jgi:hypothetical protein
LYQKDHRLSSLALYVLKYDEHQHQRQQQRQEQAEESKETVVRVVYEGEEGL